jgi:hypothetical protein
MMGRDLLGIYQGYINGGILKRPNGVPQLLEATVQPFSYLVSPKGS